MNILLTGGAGYIGSHTAVELIDSAYNVIILDNFSNSSPKVIDRIERITGKKIKYYNCDVKNVDKLTQIFIKNEIEAVIHLAGLKAVGESVEFPIKYYRNNIDAALSLCEVMQKQGVRKLIFSSSATVYGNTDEIPYKETSKSGVGITNPYGQTKHMIERMLNDLALSDSSWEITSLRYFNPIGAHQSGLIGEDSGGAPNNIMPYITQVAVGRRPELEVFGNDFETKDGTGVRDYIHVVDLARGHIAALEHLKPEKYLKIFNLGTGKGVSVMDLLNSFEAATKQKIRYRFVPRRPGDVASFYADATKAKTELGWYPKKTLIEACADSWNWQTNNPEGYS